VKKLFKYKRIYLLVLIPISFALILSAKNSSYFAEKIYALHVYKWISQVISAVSGLFPFSLAELFVYSSPLIILFLLIRFIIKLIRNKENRKSRFFKGILNILCTLSVLLFVFTLCARLNYYRYPFSFYSNLEIKESSVDELFSLTQSLAVQADELRAQTTKTDENEPLFTRIRAI
jgi:glucan phosphoethanolaminetransferase (alkaline phosphatase superfamily)